MTAILIRVTRRQIARDLRAFLDVAADRYRGGGGAGAVGLLKTVIAAVEAGDHAGAAVAGRGFGIDQRLHLIAPFGALVGAADAAQIVQRAENFGQPLQVAVKRGGGILGPGGDEVAGGDEDEEGEELLEHLGVQNPPDMPPQYARGKAQSLAGSGPEARSLGDQAPDSYFDAFSSREPVPTSLENALDQLPGRLDDLKKPAGDLEIADCIRRQPFEIVVFVVQDRPPGGPAPRKRHDQIVPAALGGRQHLAPSGELQNFDSKPGFLVDLAMQRRVQRFAEFDPAAGERVKALARRAGTANQQNLAVAKDRAADGKLGTGRLKRGNQRVIQSWETLRVGSCPNDARRSN